MIVRRNREIVVNLGNNTYESARIGAEVQLDDTHELDQKLILAAGDASKAADAALSELLADEVKYWAAITTKRDSAIHLVHGDNVAAGRSTNHKEE